MALIDTNLTVTGHLSATTMTVPASAVTNASVSADAAIERAKLQQDDLKPYAVPLTVFRVWDAVATNLPAAAANDDLGITGGTFGTNATYLTSGDVKAGGCTRYARALIPLPAEYVDGQTVTLRLRGDMQTTVSDGAATLDVQAYEVTGASETGISSDLCATAAQSFKSLTAANYDFSITPTDLAAGDMLDVRITMAIVDSATGTAVIGNIYGVTLLCDVKG